MDKNELYTVQQVADYLGVTDRTVRRLVQNKRLGCVRVSERRIVFRWEHIDIYMRQQETPTVPLPVRVEQADEVTKRRVDEWGRYVR